MSRTWFFSRSNRDIGLNPGTIPQEIAMTSIGMIRGTAMMAMIAGSACTETIDVRLQALTIPVENAPAPGMARVGITRVEVPSGELRVLQEMCKVKLDGSYLVYPARGNVAQHFVTTQDTFTTLIDIPVGEHMIELEHAPGGAAGLGDTHGDIAVAVSVTLAERSFNQIVVYGAVGAEQTKVFLDELGGVPKGSYRARVMNLLDNPEEVSVQACPTRDSCTTIKTGLRWGEVWEDVVDTEIRGASVRAGSTQLIPLESVATFGAETDVLIPPVTPGFVTTYGWHMWSYDRPDPLCPFPECHGRAVIVANFSWSPEWF
jgi:hypothetical protein